MKSDYRDSLLSNYTVRYCLTGGEVLAYIVARRCKVDMNVIYLYVLVGTMSGCMYLVRWVVGS